MKELIEIIANDKMISIMALCAGLFMGTICFIIYNVFTKFSKNGTPATGEVISFIKEKKEAEKNSFMYFPMVRFTNAEGEVIVQKNSTGYGNEPFKTLPYTKKIHFIRTESNYEVNIQNKPMEYLLIGCIVISIVISLGPLCIYLLNN